ncbi:hypothetical protein PUN28_010550 [Cardiocondyla obscurior]|uniref:Uncharacterized protein n=1 Tax=Cardiocondyla obscurior TaxID=286306 RepID=A0AAW2FM49_9HYME
MYYKMIRTVDVCRSVLSSENRKQYNITLRPASSRFVTKVSEKTGRDKSVKVSLHGMHEVGINFLLIFGSLFARANCVKYQSFPDLHHKLIVNSSQTHREANVPLPSSLGTHFTAFSRGSR